MTDLQPGDRVALLLPGSAAYVDLTIALLARGIFPVPLDPRLTAAERGGILGDVTPALVVEDEAELDQLLAAYPREPDALPLGRPMHVTSGTTGRPKAVFSGVLPPEQAEALLVEERDLWGFAAEDVNLVVSPLHHSAPLRFAVGTVLAGGRLAGLDGLDRQRGFDAGAITRAIAEQRPTTVFCVPTHLRRLFEHWDAHGWPDLSCFRLLAHAGAACPPDLKRRLIEVFPAGSTWEFYGSTEGQFTACRSEEWLDHEGTVGRARPGRELRLGDDGTIWCRIPEHARFAYFGDDAKTAAAWRGDMFTVGDLGRLDDEGYLYLDGRREDLIITGGVNVYPVEVENALRELAGVRDVAVFGRPDPEWGSRVCAAVVGEATEEQLAAFARERLSPAKRPKQWQIVAELPHTATGKVRRSELARP